MDCQFAIRQERAASHTGAGCHWQNCSCARDSASDSLDRRYAAGQAGESQDHQYYCLLLVPPKPAILMLPSTSGP